MQSFAIREGQKMTLNINMGDGKKIGKGAVNRPGGGLRALKKPLAPLSRPSGSASVNLMGFGNAAASASADTNQSQKDEFNLLDVQFDAPQTQEPGIPDLLSTMSSSEPSS